MVLPQEFLQIKNILETVASHAGKKYRNGLWAYVAPVFSNGEHLESHPSMTRASWWSRQTTRSASRGRQSRHPPTAAEWRGSKRSKYAVAKHGPQRNYQDTPIRSRFQQISADFCATWSIKHGAKSPLPCNSSTVAHPSCIHGSGFWNSIAKVMRLCIASSRSKGRFVAKMSMPGDVMTTTGRHKGQLRVLPFLYKTSARQA